MTLSEVNVERSPGPSVSIQGRWSAATKLTDWRHAPSAEGLYAIGIQADPTMAIGPSPDNDGKLGGLPDNFQTVYLGRSQDKIRGIRSRLGRHFRGKGGNRCIAEHVRAGVEFWFCCIAGGQAAGLEVMYLYFVPMLRPVFNLRPELTRSVREQAAMIRSADWTPPVQYAPDPIAPAGEIQIAGINRLPWASAKCEFSTS